MFTTQACVYCVCTVIYCMYLNNMEQSMWMLTISCYENNISQKLQMCFIVSTVIWCLHNLGCWVFYIILHTIILSYIFINLTYIVVQHTTYFLHNIFNVPQFDTVMKIMTSLGLFSNVLSELHQRHRGHYVAVLTGWSLVMNNLTFKYKALLLIMSASKQRDSHRLMAMGTKWLYRFRYWYYAYVELTKYLDKHTDVYSISL